MEKVPLGADHVALVAPPPTTPARLIDPPAQIVCGDPAFTVATGFTSTVISEEFVHPFASVPVTVYVVVRNGFAITVEPLAEDNPVDGLQE